MTFSHGNENQTLVLVGYELNLYRPYFGIVFDDLWATPMPHAISLVSSLPKVTFTSLPWTRLRKLSFHFYIKNNTEESYKVKKVIHYVVCEFMRFGLKTEYLR
jgi:hypothetical protein